MTSPDVALQDRYLAQDGHAALDVTGGADASVVLEAGSIHDAGMMQDVAPAASVQLRLEPNPNSTISALATVTCQRTSQVELELSSAGLAPGTSTRTSADLVHHIPVVGMRQETTYAVVAVAFEQGVETARSDAVAYTTGALPDGIPPFAVSITEPGLVQPGITLFAPTLRRNDATPTEVVTFLGVDEEGAVVWYHQVTSTVRWNPFIRQLPDGQLLFSVPGGFRFIDVAGETVRELSAAAADLPGFHHDGVVLPGGNLLTLSGELRQLDVPELGGAVTVLGDLISELDPDNQVVWQWSALDHLDPARCPPLCVARNDPGDIFHLTHGNALLYQAADDSVLYSARNQSWMLKIDHATGAVIWRLGAEGDFVLVGEDPAGGDFWFSAQHGPELEVDGSLLLFDNGNDRLPLEEPRFSRGVRVLLNEDSMTAEVVWQHQIAQYTPILGDADLLENGNVLLCAGGPADGAPAEVIEVTGDAAPVEVWRLTLPQRNIHRAQRVRSLYR